MTYIKFLMTLLTMLPAAVFASGLKIYKAPEGAPLNNDFTLLARQAGGQWQQVPTYLWKVSNAFDGKSRTEETSVASLDFDFSTGQAVELAVISHRQKIDSCRIRPLSYGISHATYGDTIRFSLTRSRYISVEVNGDIFHNLQIFANNPAPEVTKKMRKDKNFIYYGPGFYNLGNDSIRIDRKSVV